MNPVRKLRERAGLTQASLARAGGTSQPAIATSEACRKRPTMDTLQRLAGAAGLHANVEYTPSLTREDRRSLALHEAIARRLADDPAAVIAQARRNPARLQARPGRATQMLREWDVMLDRPVPALLAVLSDPGEWARELRHVTPFAGVVPARERAVAYRAFAAHERDQS